MQGIVKLLLLVSVLGVSACGGSDSGASNEEIQEDATTSNATPSVNAGVDMTIELVDRAVLKGTVSDDGLPSDALSVTWSQIEGPADPATIVEPYSLETEILFEVVGVYQFSLRADDGEASNRDDVTVTVVATTTSTKPTGNGDDSSSDDTASDQTAGENNDPSNDQSDTQDPVDTVNPDDNANEEEPSRTVYKTKEHSSGLRLEYIESEDLADFTDIDWMYRMWGGVAQCQGLADTTAYPTIRLSSLIAAPEEGDLLSEGESNLYRMNLENELIEVLNSGTAASAGTHQGLILAEAMSWYMGFQESDNWQGSDCASWHSGGRHDPSPGRPGIGNVDYLFENSIPLPGQVLLVKSDTADVDESALAHVGDLWNSVAKCHGFTESKPAAIKQILIVSGRSELFSGDRWGDNGGYTVNDGGQIVIDSSDLINIRTNQDWGLGLHHWMNAYLDAYADRFYPIYECRDLTGIYGEPPLPIQFD